MLGEPISAKDCIMAITLAQATNHLIEVSNKTVVALTASRVVYFAHMLHMGETEGGLLVSDRFFAMPTGPGTPEMQLQLSKRGQAPLRYPFAAAPFKIGREGDAIAKAWAIMKDLSPERIIHEVQREKTAFARTYERNRVAAMSDRSIMEEFLFLHDDS